MARGHGPMVNLKPEEVAALKAGGKSIDELTGKLKIFIGCVPLSLKGYYFQ